MSGQAEEAAVQQVRAATLDLGSNFRGQALRPGDDAYDAAPRIWNGAIDRRIERRETRDQFKEGMWRVKDHEARTICPRAGR